MLRTGFFTRPRLIFQRITTNLVVQQQRWIKRNQLPPRPKLTPEDERDIQESFMHGGRGPGGQKINKSNSKVQLHHVSSGIVVTCQETRSRERNRKIARERLAEKLAESRGDTARRDAVINRIQQRKNRKKRRSHAKYAARATANNSNSDAGQQQAEENTAEKSIRAYIPGCPTDVE